MLEHERDHNGDAQDHDDMELILHEEGLDDGPESDTDDEQPLAAENEEFEVAEDADEDGVAEREPPIGVDLARVEPVPRRHLADYDL